jgi:hypothetical protein
MRATAFRCAKKTGAPPVRGPKYSNLPADAPHGTDCTRHHHQLDFPKCGIFLTINFLYFNQFLKSIIFPGPAETISFDGETLLL